MWMFRAGSLDAKKKRLPAKEKEQLEQMRKNCKNRLFDIEIRELGKKS